MKLSVVIPTHNRRSLIARTLPPVLVQDLASDDYEVIVVVDGSTDGTDEYLRGLTPACAMCVLQQPNRGPAAARNAGLRAARGDIVLFLDDDILCGPTLLREHLAVHDGGEEVVVFGPVTLAPESPPGIAADCLGEWLDGRIVELMRRGGPSSASEAMLNHNWSVRRSALLTHGGYDERLRTHEDADLALRLWKAGVQFKFHPDAVSFHIYGKSVDELAVNDWPQYARQELEFCRMHPEYAPRSPLARYVAGARWRRALGWAALCSQGFVDPLLAAALSGAKRFRAIPGVRRIGMNLFHLRRAAATLRAAVEETGSWGDLCREFGEWRANIAPAAALSEKTLVR